MKHTYILGSMILSTLLFLGIILILVVGGVIGGGSDKLVFCSDSAERVYNGEPLKCETWYLEEGALQEGHTAEVTMHNAQTDAGVKKNTFSVKICDENGADVTSDYDITTLYGDLRVLKRSIAIRTGDASKMYDGTPLVCNEWVLTSTTEPVKGHTLEVVISGTRTDIGEAPNSVAEYIVTDANGKDVSKNYDFSSSQFGALVVMTDLNLGGGGGGSGEGSGNGSGGMGGSNPDSPYKIGLPEGDDIGDPDEIIARVLSERDGKVYLRRYSLGAYTGTTWEPATPYEGASNSPYSMNYLMGMALEQAGYARINIEIEQPSGEYVLPYYLPTGTEYGYLVQTNDVRFDGATDGAVSLSYFAYTHGASPLAPGSLSSQYAAIEREYRDFVYSQYLQIPDSTKQFMLELAQQQGIDSSDPDVLVKLAEYIKGAAQYSKDYDRALDTEADIAVAFLSEYQMGICQHYATAATMMLRALGIPARYTRGLVADATANEWCDVSSMQRHAWVEVYLDGAGWIYLEVTGAGAAGGNPGGETPGGENPEPPSEEPEDTREKLELKPATLQKAYDGTPLDVVIEGTTLVSKDLETRVKKGYSYTVTFGGAQTEVGYGESEILDFRLFDPDGVDVTDQYNVIKKKGRLHVYLAELDVSSGDKTQEYNGTPLVSDDDAYSFDRSQLLDPGHEVYVEFTASITNAGTVQNRFEVTVKDADSNDVTYMYKIQEHPGTLEITRIEITLTAGSGKKTYDGLPLVVNTFNAERTLSDGESVLLEKVSGGEDIYLPGILLDGHTISVEVGCKQAESTAERGSWENEILKVKIKDAEGKDVTENYLLILETGSLRVLRAR